MTRARIHIVPIRMTEAELASLDAVCAQSRKTRSDILRESFQGESALLDGRMTMGDAFRDLSPEAPVARSIRSIPFLLRFLRKRV